MKDLAAMDEHPEDIELLTPAQLRRCVFQILAERLQRRRRPAAEKDQQGLDDGGIMALDIDQFLAAHFRIVDIGEIFLPALPFQSFQALGHEDVQQRPDAALLQFQEGFDQRRAAVTGKGDEKRRLVISCS